MSQTLAVSASMLVIFVVLLLLINLELSQNSEQASMTMAEEAGNLLKMVGI